MCVSITSVRTRIKALICVSHFIKRNTNSIPIISIHIILSWSPSLTTAPNIGPTKYLISLKDPFPSDFESTLDYCLTGGVEANLRSRLF